jgi:hypothetical protein
MKPARVLFGTALPDALPTRVYEKPTNDPCGAISDCALPYPVERSSLDDLREVHGATRLPLALLFSKFSFPLWLFCRLFVFAH